ncbi:tetratricopeptide repeat protein [Mangrovicoccus algicola]|uniref:Tetratricopeptide repeat protein n=1 Tax=Mangrovicoccus algicola TaxID=2771008 RepID=A0A8J7D104_9RHOB|nr:hypothetical protein [Mangrovicoccus algicola]MBE3640183.1 hypothetical protein [Mangrovicoccus algicola]
MFRTLPLAALILAAPIAVLAAGSDMTTPPVSTETTRTCTDGMVWSDRKGACIAPQSGALDDDVLYGAVREFAYAGQYGDAAAALDAMSDQHDDRVLTYRGFIARKSGDVAGGMQWYRAALSANPDNLLVRSYMGQGLVESGDPAGARDQLAEIRLRGGAGSWAELALARAIRTGHGFSY